MSALADHLAGGETRVCRCWAVTRRDGVTLGFTDHDRTIAFDGITFTAGAGMTARAVVQGTGLAVDNSEALGVLSDAAITDRDIAQGRYDGAEVTYWLVNWQNPDEREIRFRGNLGEIRRGAGAFEAELRGLSEPLNQPQGRVYQRMCGAILGDGKCGFDPESPGFAVELPAGQVERAQVFVIDEQPLLEPRWFERGRLRVLTGAGAGLVGIVKADTVLADGRRRLDLWEPIPAEIIAGDSIRVEPGCDKRAETCRNKFDNFVNFQGFPHIPGEDWLVKVPVAASDAGGSGTS